MSELSWTKGALGAALFGLALALSPPAAAAPSGSETERFAQLIRDSTEARDAGRLADAVDLLERAYEILPSPKILNNIGLLQEKLGLYREAMTTYLKVVEDPKADPELRALDAGRVAALRSRLGKAWVLATLKPAHAELLVDGRPPNAPAGEPFSVDAGDHWLEGAVPGGGDLWVEKVRFPLDRQSGYTLDLRTRQPDEGRLSLRGIAPRPTSITIDGHALGHALVGIEGIRIQPGTWRITASFDGAPSRRATVTVAAGEDVALSELLSAGTKAPALAPAEADPSATAPHGAGSGAGPWPWVVAGVGVATAGAGIALTLLGEGDHDRVRDATREGGVVTGITYAEAARAVDDGDSKKGLGAALLVAGSAIVVGGVVWGVVDLSSGPEAEGDVRVSVLPGGLMLSGGF